MIEQLRNPPPQQYTRAQLIQLARERGLRGYSRLRKSQLHQRLGVPRAQILDENIDARMENVPFLTPTQYTPPQSTPVPSPSSNTYEDLIDYLYNTIPKSAPPRSAPPWVKKLQKKIKRIYKRMNIFKVKESNSALRNFAKVYTIDGKLGFGAKSF